MPGLGRILIATEMTLCRLQFVFFFLQYISMYISMQNVADSLLLLLVCSRQGVELRCC